MNRTSHPSDDRVRVSQLSRTSFERLERSRSYSLVATLSGALGLAAVVATSFAVPAGYLDSPFIAVSAITLLASTALTVLSFRIASLRPARTPSREAAKGMSIRRAALIAFGLVALVGNVVAAFLGHVSILTWLLAGLVGALILIIRYRDQHRHPPRE
jgi:Na+/H+ antiporter NhaD/arsenite permease-like protein